MSRVILITGASGVIGSELTSYFLDRGDTIIAITRSDKSKEKLENLSFDKPGKLFNINLDLENDEISTRLLVALNKIGLYPDSIISAARNLSRAAFSPEKSVVQDFMDEFYLNAVVPFEIVNTLQNNNKSKLKSVVNIGSIYGIVVPNTNIYEKSENYLPIHYGVVKSALHQLTREMAVRFAEEEIRINCVAFGGVRGRSTSYFEKKYSENCPTHRMLHLSEVCGPVDFLLSDASSSITGQVLVADGGWTLW